nr:GNAT family N-acetyltransferase [Paenibacillus sp. P13VS]
MQLLADDEFGVARERYEKSLPKEYLEAFTKIEQQIGYSLIVAIDNGVVIGCLQLTIIPGISRLGATRGQIEGVRVDKNYRGKGVGEELFRYAINQAKTMGCDMI